jgi:hypothetical protein
MNREEFIKKLHPAITHVRASDEMSEETLEAINIMVEKVSKMSKDEIKKLIKDNKKIAIDATTIKKREGMTLSKEILINELGFKKLPHITVGDILIYQLGRHRHLSIGSYGTPNEMLVICETNPNDMTTES